MRAVDLAKNLGVSRQRVYVLLRQGRIKGATQNELGRWQIPEEAEVIPKNAASAHSQST